MIVTSPDGFTWDIGGNESDDHLALGGHEPNLAPILYSLASRDKTYINVGAHVGTWAIRVAAYVAEVLAIEANPRTMQKLIKNIWLNSLEGKVFPLCVPVWDKAFKRIKLVDVNGKETGGSTRVELDSESEGALTMTLDMLCVGNTMPVGLVSMDVEGAEAKVLAGAKGMINRDRPNMLIELHQGHPGTDPNLRQQVYDLLDELGYDYMSVNVAPPEEHLICTPKERPLDEPVKG